LAANDDDDDDDPARVSRLFYLQLYSNVLNAAEKEAKLGGRVCPYRKIYRIYRKKNLLNLSKKKFIEKLLSINSINEFDIFCYNSKKMKRCKYQNEVFYFTFNNKSKYEKNEIFRNFY
jgi:hypothetical protein